jgi:1-deoxy-D-xylulose-5-phosphate reductoisomerase
MAVCNAANEVAVAAFLAGQIGFRDIAAVIEDTLAALPPIEPASLDEVEAVDCEAREYATRRLSGGHKASSNGGRNKQGAMLG